jgi:glutamine amidotransferase
MCRHLAYLGPPVRLGELLVDPPHGLVRQSWAPRLQRHGVVNADGFGVGWYVDGDDEPARHRGAGPVWADETFADLGRVIRSRALLAAVRSATPGMPPGSGAAAPLRRGRWLFSHNGRVDGWPKAAEPLAARLPPAQLLELASMTDSALLFALVHDRLERGLPAGTALADVVALVRGVTSGRFNLLLTDGVTLAATCAGDTLCWRRLSAHDCEARGADGTVTGAAAGPGGVVVASEPYDDDSGWQDVPDGRLLVVDGSGVALEAL